MHCMRRDPCVVPSSRHLELVSSSAKTSMEQRTMQLQLEQAEAKAADMLQSWRGAEAAAG